MTYELAYREALRGSRSSADEVVPIILDLLQPESIIDLGCGLGTWLSVFERHGVTDYLGINEREEFAENLEIPPERLQIWDLAGPLGLDRSFDIALSLEVAEHLPQSSAAAFVDTLVALAPAVVFSAAIPQQGGTGHVNEQWPEYWADLFADHGYLTVDCFRDRLWQNSSVRAWYPQNMLLFASRDYLDSRPHLAASVAGKGSALARVHPRMFLARTDPRLLPPRRLLAAMPYAAQRELRRAWDRVRPSRGGRRGG